jgi:hypothetical protein
MTDKITTLVERQQMRSSEWAEEGQAKQKSPFNGIYLLFALLVLALSTGTLLGALLIHLITR